MRPLSSASTFAARFDTALRSCSLVESWASRGGVTRACSSTSTLSASLVSTSITWVRYGWIIDGLAGAAVESGDGVPPNAAGMWLTSAASGIAHSNCRHSVHVAGRCAIRRICCPAMNSYRTDVRESSATDDGSPFHVTTV